MQHGRTNIAAPLYLMASRPGAVFTRAALLQEVWSDDTYVTDRTVDTVSAGCAARSSAILRIRQCC